MMRKTDTRDSLFTCMCFPADAGSARSSRSLCLGPRSSSSGLDSCRCDDEGRGDTRYGQPDLVIASPGGDTAIYRPTASGPSAPRVEIPTVQAGPLGSATTRMQPINPALGANDMNTKTKERLRSEIHIRYDARGVVQELSSP